MANITTQKIRVDLNTGKVIPTAYTHQNDTARTLVFDMYNEGLPYSMTGHTVKFAYKSPIVNGRYTVIAGSSMASGTVSGTTVSVTLPAAYTAISGVGLLTMIITPTSGTIRPVNIKFIVQKSADGDDEIAGASDFPASLDEIAENWLDENISIQIDDTLSVSGKAADAKVTGDEISELDGKVTDLKSELNFVNSELLSINGSYYLDLEKKQRYVNNGAEAIANNAAWLSLRQGKYINFKTGDVVYTLGGYNIRVMTSVDGGSTWVMSSANSARITIENDCIGWISVIKSSAVDDSDIENINNNHIVGILRAGSDSIRKINAEIFAISNTEVLRAKEGLTYVYVNTTVTVNGGTDDIIDSVPVSKGDILTLKFDAETLKFPNNFNDIGIAVREINSSGTVIKNEYLLLSEKKQIEYTVYYEAAVKLIANINLVRSGETVSTGYYEPVKYTVAVTKGDSSDDVYTEAGQIWEV